MNDTISENKNKRVKMNPFINSFIKPRETINYVIKDNSFFNYRLLVCLFGLTATASIIGNELVNKSILFTIIIIALTPLYGFIKVNLFAWTLSWFDNVFKGDASRDELKEVVLWSNIPLIAFSFIFIIINLLNFSSFESTNLLFNLLIIGVSLVFSLLYSAARIWCFINMVRMIAEVQNYSIIKSVITVAAPYFLAFIVSVFLIKSLYF